MSQDKCPSSTNCSPDLFGPRWCVRRRLVESSPYTFEMSSDLVFRPDVTSATSASLVAGGRAVVVPERDPKPKALPINPPTDAKTIAADPNKCPAAPQDPKEQHLTLTH